MNALRSLRIYSSYFRRFLTARLEYKLDFFASIIANILMTTSGLLFIAFLVDGEAIPSIQGWSRDEVLFIYGYSLLSMAIFTTFAPNLYQFGDRYIIQGQFDRVLLRPLNSVAQVLFESFNLESVGSLLTGIGVLAYASNRLQLTFTALDYLWLAASVLSGGIILLSVFIAIASLSFHFEDRLGISAPIFSLITFGRYPTPIFNHTIQFILRWVVPFAFVAFYPATHFLGRTEFRTLCFCTPLVALVAATLATSAWIFGVSRYSSTGN